MSNQPTDKKYDPKDIAKKRQSILLYMLRGEGGEDAERYLAGEDDSRFHRWTKEEVAEALPIAKGRYAADEIYRDTTFQEWLEIARDFYQDNVGAGPGTLKDYDRSKRRPALFEPEFLSYLEMDYQYTGGNLIDDGHPEKFLNAVYMLAKDPDVDPDNFQSLPWDAPEGVRSWQTYLKRAAAQFKLDPKDLAYDDVPWEACFPGEPDSDGLVVGQESRVVTVGCPNCEERVHMPARAFLIWHFARGCAGRDNVNEIWLSKRVVMERTGIGDNATVKKYTDLLVKKGWLMELKAPRQGVGGEGRYRVVTHQEWIKTHGTIGCIQVTPEEAERKRAAIAALKG